MSIYLLVLKTCPPSNLSKPDRHHGFI